MILIIFGYLDRNYVCGAYPDLTDRSDDEGVEDEVSLIQSIDVSLQSPSAQFLVLFTNITRKQNVSDHNIKHHRDIALITDGCPAVAPHVYCYCFVIIIFIFGTRCIKDPSGGVKMSKNQMQERENYYHHYFIIFIIIFYKYSTARNENHKAYTLAV